jgi:hypothetical protein
LIKAEAGAWLADVPDGPRRDDRTGAWTLPRTPTVSMAAIGKAMAAQTEHAEAHPIPKLGEVGRGRKRGSVRTSMRGETADYLARRIARDHPG